MKEASKQWSRINQRIHSCLREAVLHLSKVEKISSTDRDEFFISSKSIFSFQMKRRFYLVFNLVTEKEIMKGILNVNNANERTLCFLREIEDIYDHLDDRKAPKYIDMTQTKDKQWIIDSDAESLLNRLKTKRIPDVLQSDNIYQYSVPWNSKGITQETHSEYIAKFNNDFYEAVKKQIDDCIRSNSMLLSNPLHREILEHAIQCKNYIKKFHGQKHIIDRVRLTEIMRTCFHNSVNHLVRTFHKKC